jgi:hypothetical protein
MGQGIGVGRCSASVFLAVGLSLLLAGLVTAVCAVAAERERSAVRLVDRAEGPDPKPAFVGARCATLTQSIVRRKKVTCRTAKRVAARASRAVGPLPECVGDRPRRYRGWRITGPGLSDRDQALQTRFRKGKRRFVLIGGGIC